jgi:hypothetical protein
MVDTRKKIVIVKGLELLLFFVFNINLTPNSIEIINLAKINQLISNTEF